MLLRRFFSIFNARRTTVATRNFNSRRQKTISQVRGNYKVRLSRFRIFRYSLNAMSRNGTISHNRRQINNVTMGNFTATHYRSNSFKGRNVRLTHHFIRRVNAMTLSTKNITNGSSSLIVLNGSFRDMVINRCNSIKILLRDFGRTNLCLYAHVILVIRSTRFKITTFFIRIGLSILLFIRIRSPFSGLLSLFKNVTRRLLCNFAITCPIAHGRNVFSVLFGVICNRVNSENSASLYGVDIYLFRAYLAGRNCYSFVHCFRHGARANGSKTSGRGVRLSCREFYMLGTTGVIWAGHETGWTNLFLFIVWNVISVLRPKVFL